MKQGDIMLVKSSGLFGKLISLHNLIKFSRSDATHVGIVAEVEKDKVLVYEAVMRGFHKFWYEYSWLEKNPNFTFKRPKDKLTNVLENCKKYEGTKYGKINIVIHTINLFLSLVFMPKIKYSDGVIAGHCSEMVSRVLYDSSNKKIDFEKELNKPFDLVSPQEIFMSKQLDGRL